MKRIKYRLSLDMFEVASQTTIKAKRGDSACEIHITLTKNGKIYKISEGCHATFSAKKSDGNYIYDNCTIEGDTIVYDFTSSIDENGGCQVSACEGTVECEVALFKGVEQLTSPRFTLVIDGTVYNGEEIVSSPEAGVLKELINEAEATVQDIETKLANGDFKGDKGDQGDKGDKGDTGAPGKDGAKGDKGDKGDTGATGAQGEPGKDGADGKDGTSATHSWNGTVLTITSASGTSSADLKGEKGDKGDKGEQGEKGDKGDRGEQGIQGIKGAKGDKGDAFTYEDFTPEQLASLKGEKGDTGAAGKNGEDGYTPVKGVDYFDGVNGKDGKDGADGYTPVRGADYWTSADKAEIKSYVDEAILGGAW